MKKISLILLIPFGSLIGISILFNVYNDYLKMAASQYNYDYLYICLFRLLEALILFISILVYMKDIQKEDNKLIYLFNRRGSNNIIYNDYNHIIFHGKYLYTDISITELSVFMDISYCISNL
jgi:hypothetical protein